MSLQSQTEGDLAERLAELSFNQYQADGRLIWFRTYPEIKVLYRGQDEVPQVIITGEATPDYLICLAGRLLWLEIKTWSALSRHSETRRLHQYKQMVETVQAGGLATYLVRWKWNGIEEWRLHPVQGLAGPAGNSLTFLRENGQHVSSEKGWPDWLPALYVWYIQHWEKSEANSVSDFNPSITR